MKAALILSLVFFGAFVGAADTKPAAPKTTATKETPAAKPKSDKIPDVPASPPRMTVESTPGVPFATAFYENQQIRVSTDKIPALNAAIRELAAANLTELYGKLHSGHDLAVQTAFDAATFIKDNERDQERLDRCQKASDAKDKSSADKADKKKKLAAAKKDFDASSATRKKHEDQAADALTKYTDALDAYNKALAAVAPSIEKFVSTAGFPKDRGGK